MKSRRRYRLFVNAMYSTSSSKNTTKVEDQEKRIDALTAQLKKSRQDKSRRRAHSLERANSPQDESAVADLRRAWSKSLEPRSQHFTISRHASPHGGFLFPSRAPEQQSRGPEGEHEDWGEPPPFLFVRLSFVESHEKIDKSRTRDRTVVRTFFLRCGFMIQ